MFITFRRKHFVDGKHAADFTQKVDVVQVFQPVGVVDHNRGVFALERQKFAHLFLKAIAVMLHGVGGHDLSQIASSRRIADHTRASADKDNGTMPRFLHPSHDDKLNEVSDVQAVRRRIEADIKRHVLRAELFI